jgi:prepilin-type N-terminal cleavage/methylation domain-containing protein
VPRLEVGTSSPHGHGFTLLEVLVALLVFGLVFGVLAQIFQTGSRQSSTAEGISTATLLARSHLARVGVDRPLEIGETEESDDGFRVRTVIQPAEFEETELELIPLLVQVTVAWEREGQVALTTLRLGPAQSAEDR